MSASLTIVFRVGQNRIYTRYMTVYLVISLPKTPFIHTYMALASPTCVSKILKAEQKKKVDCHHPPSPFFSMLVFFNASFQGGSSKSSKTPRWASKLWTDHDRSDMVAVGTAAGVAAAFRSPVGG